MIGFESYSPQSWLAEKILSIHVNLAQIKPAAKTAFRKGKWSSNAVAGVMATAAIVTSGILLGPPTSVAGGISRVVHSSHQQEQAESFADASPLYYEKLTTLVQSAPKLPAQTLAFDPPALV